MLEAIDLHAAHGRSPVLMGVSLRVAPGEIVGLLGRNGAGRSTLLKTLMGLTTPGGLQRTGGAVHWQGRPIHGLGAHRIARLGLGYVPEGREVFPALSVHQNLLLGLKPANGLPGWRRAVAVQADAALLAEAYRRFPSLAARRDTLAGALSGGEQQMLSLARTLAGQPQVLLVDEPTEGLAPAVVAQVAELLRGLRRQGVGVLLVEQKLAIALDVADRCLVLGRGRVVFEGTPAQVRAAADVQQEWLAV